MIICGGEVSVPKTNCTLLLIKRGKGYRGFRYCKPCQIVTIRDQVHIEYVSWLSKVRTFLTVSECVSERHPNLRVYPQYEGPQGLET